MNENKGHPKYMLMIKDDACNITNELLLKLERAKSFSYCNQE